MAGRLRGKAARDADSFYQLWNKRKKLAKKRKRSRNRYYYHSEENKQKRIELHTLRGWSSRVSWGFLECLEERGFMAYGPMQNIRILAINALCVSRELMLIRLLCARFGGVGKVMELVETCEDDVVHIPRDPVCDPEQGTDGVWCAPPSGSVPTPWLEQVAALSPLATQPHPRLDGLEPLPGADELAADAEEYAKSGL